MGTFWKCVLVKLVLTKFVLTKDLVYLIFGQNFGTHWGGPKFQLEPVQNTIGMWVEPDKSWCILHSG